MPWGKYEKSIILGGNMRNQSYCVAHILFPVLLKSEHPGWLWMLYQRKQWMYAKINSKETYGTLLHIENASSGKIHYRICKIVWQIAIYYENKERGDMLVQMNFIPVGEHKKFWVKSGHSNLEEHVQFLCKQETFLEQPIGFSRNVVRVWYNMS